MGADAALGRLLEVKNEGRSVRSPADRHLEQGGAGTWPPGRLRVERVGFEVEQVEQADRAGSGRSHRPPVEPERGLPPGDGFAEREATGVGPDPGDQATPWSGLLEGGRPVVVEADARGELGRLTGGVAG